MLAINTAFFDANLALEGKNGQVFEKTIDAKSKHAEIVLKSIDELCKSADVDVLDLETVAVVTGPGSFTGLRIGTAIAKALGCASKKLKFVSLSSLELMAYIIAKNKLASKKFVCALNALSNLYFVAYFDKSGIKIKEEKMIDKTEFEKIKSPIFVLKGDLPGENEIEITSLDLFQFAKQKENEKCFVSIENLSPLYLRLSQAEDSLLKKQKKDNKIS